MIQLRTILTPADNAGAKRLRMVHVYRGGNAKTAGIGDIVLAVVDQADNNAAVKDSEKVRCVIIRTKKEYRRADGSYIRFDDNAAVVIDKDGNPVGTRVFGPVAREIKDRGYVKIVSLASEVI